jgi:hypothetical protein
MVGSKRTEKCGPCSVSAGVPVLQNMHYRWAYSFMRFDGWSRPSSYESIVGESLHGSDAAPSTGSVQLHVISRHVSKKSPVRIRPMHASRRFPVFLLGRCLPIRAECWLTSITKPLQTYL